MDRTIPVSPLAQRLEELVRKGVVQPNPMPIGEFPSARITIPVYDSNGTQLVSGVNGGTYAELARDS